jgi:hypothetical protein
VVITRDGHRVDAMEKPVVEEGRVKIRLAPGGQLAVLFEDSIDWEATERFNAPRPSRAKRPAPATGTRAGILQAGAAPGKPVEMRIVGGKRSLATSTDREDAAGGAAAAAGATADADPAEAARRLAELARQMSNVKTSYDSAVQSRTRLQQRLTELQQAAARNPRTAQPGRDYESPSQKALREVQAQLEAANQQITALERRMNDLRFQAIQLGGSID